MGALKHVSLVFVCGLAAMAPARAEGWCSVVFKDVAREAELVLLARVDGPKESPVRLSVVEVLKGEYRATGLALATHDAGLVPFKGGDILLLALDHRHRPVSGVRGLGACDPISMLLVRGGKLRARDRENYDSREGPLALDELRGELARELAVVSRATRGP